MKRQLSRILAVALIAFSSACALSVVRISLTCSSILVDIKTAPSPLNGVVTDSWGVPLLPYKFYRVDDGTGQIAVLSDSSRMPGKGEHVRVKGRVGNVAVFGGRSLGLHLREEDLDVKRQ